MKFCIITHVVHTKIDDEFYGYAPYINEMNIWSKYIDKLIIVAPISNNEITPILNKYTHKNVEFITIPEISLKSFNSILKSFYLIPFIFYKIFLAYIKSNHIHLRCPGNIGLLGSIVQVFFPLKKKTAKYAGNWDPKSNQPWSYRLQKWILSNTFLTKNIQVLVYGNWGNQTKNIKPFFTATYSQKEIQNSEFRIQKLDKNGPIKFLFVGTLSLGKQPLYALQIVNELIKKGFNVTIDFYGEGNQREIISNYIKTNDLDEVAVLKGNQSKEVIEKAYKTSHFLILPSKSEGWPKVVAEAMFWKCLPIATKISCVPYMLDNGNRGIFLKENLNDDVLQLLGILKDEKKYNKMSQDAQQWSREFTLESFETEIKKLLL